MHLEQLLDHLNKAKQYGVLAPVFGVVAPTSMHVDIAEKIRQLLEVEIFDIHLLQPLPDKQVIEVAIARKWQSQLFTSPRGKYKIGFIVPADRMKKETANTLLKILEEPPQNCYLVLIMTRNNLLPTIRSRAHVYSLTDEEQNNQPDTPNTLSAIIKTAGQWASEKSVKANLNNLLPTLRADLKAGRLSAQQVQLALTGLTQKSLGLDQKLLAEKILLSYDI